MKKILIIALLFSVGLTAQEIIPMKLDTFQLEGKYRSEKKVPIDYGAFRKATAVKITPIIIIPHNLTQAESYRRFSDYLVRRFKDTREVTFDGAARIENELIRHQGGTKNANPESLFSIRIFGNNVESFGSIYSAQAEFKDNRMRYVIIDMQHGIETNVLEFSITKNSENVIEEDWIYPIKKRNGKAVPLVDRNSLKNILKYFNDEAKRIQHYLNTEEYLGLLEISSDNDDW
jgi:hypothetical protein